MFKKYKSFTFKTKSASHTFVVFVEEKNFEVNRQRFVEYVKTFGGLSGEYASGALEYDGDWVKYEIKVDKNLAKYAKVNAAYIWEREEDEDEEE